MADMPGEAKTELDLEARKFALEERRLSNDFEIAQQRLLLEARQVGRFSTGTVTVIGAGISLATAVAVALVTGLFDLSNAQQDRVNDRDVQAQEIAAAERRLVIEQNFNIIVQATKDVPVDIAADNLKFFVEAGILPDPEGKILALANEGIAPTLSSTQRVANPLMERASALSPIANPDAFTVAEGLLAGGSGRSLTYLVSPNLSAANEPIYAIMHFTGAFGADSARWLADAQANASAHLLIGLDGAVTQLVPFDYGAWHAGQSRYGSVTGFNRQSIGIMLENAGAVTGGAGQWQSLGTTVPDALVGVAPDGSGHWQIYPEAQIEALVAVLLALREAYPDLVDLLGHSDIAPGRKSDPGPLFPIEQVRMAVFGRSEALPPP